MSPRRCCLIGASFTGLFVSGWGVAASGGRVPPRLLAKDVVNAASMASGPVAPGEILLMFPTGAGPREIVGMETGNDGRARTIGGNTRVLFDGIPAPVVYAVEDHISVVVPYAVGRVIQTQVVVEYQGLKSAPVTLPVVAAAPALYTRDRSGQGLASMLNQTGCCNSEQNPAVTGSIATLFATGAGETNPPGIDGYLVPTAQKVSDYAAPRQPVHVTIGGKAAEVIYAGAAPHFIAGVLQVNFRIPADAPTGDAIPLVLMVGKAESSANVTMAVRPSRQRVLMIAADAAVRARYRRILPADRYDARIVEDDAAVSRQAGERVDLVVSDLGGRTRTVSRLQTLRAIQGAGPQVRITAVADELNPDVLREADLLGAQFVFTPRLSDSEVLEHLEQLLRPQVIRMTAEEPQPRLTDFIFRRP